MNNDLEKLEGIDAYNLNDDNNLLSPLCIIIDGIFDIESFNDQFPIFKEHEQKIIQMFKNIYFLSLSININNLKEQINIGFERQHYSIYSIFLKESFAKNMIKEFSIISENSYYLFYEEKTTFITNDEIFSRSLKVQTTSKYPRKYLFEFPNFTELVTNYIKLIETRKQWPIYAILPFKNGYQLQNHFDNCLKVNQAFPIFSPLQTIYYISFIEQFPPKPQRKMNVDEIYSIKQISDAQISHLSQIEPSEIRTFLGFENKFRCLHVFDYLIQHSNSMNFKKIKILLNSNEIELSSQINSNLFYLEIQNMFNYSILFSIEYQDSFILTDDSNYSTFLSFSNENEMKKAKLMVKSSFTINSPYTIKNMKSIDCKEYSSIFLADENSNNNSFYIMIRLKYFNKTEISKSNNDFSMKLKKHSNFVKSDLICKLNNKRYFVAGFDTNQKRDDVFASLMKDSKSAVLMKSYYPEDYPIRKQKKGIEANAANRGPLFKPKKGMFYIYFEEYQRSKSFYPSNVVRPLFGVTNLSDLQRNYFLPNDPKEYTFIGFSKEEDLIQLLKEVTSRSNVLYTNALNGIIYRFNNNENESTNEVENESESLMQKNANENVSVNANNSEQQNSNKDSKETTANAANRGPLFKPKKGMFYIYFEEYQRSKSFYPSNVVRPLFGVTNLSDLQRNYFLPNDPKEYTFIGFSKEEDLTQLLKEVTTRSNVLYTNALNGIIYRFNNNENTQRTNSNQSKNDISANQTATTSNNSKRNQIFHYSYDNENSKIPSNDASNDNSQDSKIASKITNPDNKKPNKDKQINGKPTKNESNDNNKTLIVNNKKYEMKDLLGTGSHGPVYIIEDISTGIKYAAKTQIKERNAKSNYPDDFEQEIDFYTRFEFPFILSIKAIIDKSLKDGYDKTTMILEYMQNGSLDKALENKTIILSQSQKYLILYGIVVGMKYLHSQDVVHRDLKPASILLDENFYPRISDFGFAIIYSDRNKFVRKQENEKTGSLIYMAPEIFLDKDPCSFKIDVYAFSMIAYQLLTNKQPYFEKNYELKNKLKKDVIDGVRPDLSFISDTEIQSFFRRCWSPEPTERPSFSEIYDTIITLKFKSIFQVNEFDILKLDYWYKDKLKLKPYQLNEMITQKLKNISSKSEICSFLSSFKLDINDLRNHAYRLYYGIGIPANKSIALKCFIYAVTKGDVESMYHYASILNEMDPNNSDINLCLKKAADQGHEKSMIAYAKRLLSNGNKSDDKKAAGYFKTAASQRNPEGLFYCGKMLQTGRGVLKQDESKANEYFKQSAELGYKEGIYQYAYNNENGIGCKTNYEEASKYYKIASFYGDVRSMINLGKMLNNGELKFDIDQSIRYLKSASNYDDDEGIYECAKDLLIKAINSDNEKEIAMKQSINYFKKLIDKGNSIACFSYSNILFLNAFYQFLDNSNTIKESFTCLSSSSSSNNKICQSHYNLLKSDLFIKNEVKIHANEIDLLLFNYGSLILKNTIKNHELIIDCIFFFIALKRYQKNPQEIVSKIIEQDSFNSLSTDNFKYFKYIIEIIRKENYIPYSAASIAATTNEQSNEEIPVVIPQKQIFKRIQDVKVNTYESFVLDSYCCFSFSQSTIPQSIRRELNIYFKRLPEFMSIQSNVCNPEDPNDLYTYIVLKLFSPKMPANEFMMNKGNEIMTDMASNDKIDQEDRIIYLNSYMQISVIHLQFEPIFERNGFPVAMGLFSGMPLGPDYLYFDENFLPKDLLDQLLEYLHTIKEIKGIHRNVYNGRQIVTSLFIEKESEKKIYNLVKKFLLPKDVVFKASDYPLQNTIVLNEKLVLKEKNDFNSILNEIESIGIKPINVERDKLYLYEEFYARKLFQKFSFICFKNEIDKMKAVNHINSIVYKGKKNVLNYNLDLHYASLNDKCFSKCVRDAVPKIFNHIKGIKDIQRYVYSIESPVDRTYVGFDSPKHLKKCYYKFTYMKNLIHFNINNYNFFWRKNNYKYLMVNSNFYYALKNHNKKFIEEILKSSKDLQENCFELDEPYPKTGKRTIPCFYNFIGYEKSKDVDNAFNYLDEITLDGEAKEYFRKYHEGYSLIDATEDPKEAYLFYNSL